MRHSSTAGAGVWNNAGFGLCELAVLYHRSDSHALAGESGKAGNNYGYGAERSCREADRSSWNTRSRSNYGCRAVLWNGYAAVFCFEGSFCRRRMSILR